MASGKPQTRSREKLRCRETGSDRTRGGGVPWYSRGSVWLIPGITEAASRPGSDGTALGRGASNQLDSLETSAGGRGSSDLRLEETGES